MDILSTRLVTNSESSARQPTKVKRVEQGGTPEVAQQPKSVVVSPDDAASHNARAYQQFIRDEGSSYAQQAISSYQQFEQQSQRDSIAAMFGVDIYA